MNKSQESSPSSSRSAPSASEIICPACKYDGKCLQHNVFRFRICPECGNIFMDLRTAKAMQDFHSPSDDHQKIECECSLCKSEGPFIMDQGNNFLICMSCGNVFVEPRLAQKWRLAIQGEPILGKTVTPLMQPENRPSDNIG